MDAALPARFGLPCLPYCVESRLLFSYSVFRRTQLSNKPIEMPRTAQASNPSETVAVQSNDLFRLLVESVKEYAIFVLGVEGRVLTWNAGAQAIKGYTPDEIIGQH